MSKPDPKTTPSNSADLTIQKQALLERPGDEQALHRYFQAAVAAQRVGDAKATLDRLQRQNPGNHHIRRLRIATRLHQKDHGAAMAMIETLVAFSALDDALMRSALQVRRKVGPRRIQKEDAGDPTLSLCMMVRNEQASLGACLNSAKGLADEIVVVDTGSTDRSMDIATIYGARVYPFQWRNDFSAARNFSLQKAKGEWVLILDADEIIAADDQSRLKDLLIQYGHEPRAFSFQTRNYSNLANGLNWQANNGSYPAHEAGMGWFPSAKVRLFPRDEAIRFHYPVHELVEPSLKQAGIDISKCPIPIHHYGNLNEARIKRKAHHYFQLGYAKLEQLGNDEVALRELAIQAGQIERWSESVELWQRFLSICPHDGEGLANMAGACWQLGAYAEGMEFAQKAIISAPNLKEGHYNLAANGFMGGRIQDAITVLRKLTMSHPDYLAARFLLAAAYTVCGQNTEAAPIYQQLIHCLSKDGLQAALKKIIDKLRVNRRAEDADALAQTAREMA